MSCKDPDCPGCRAETFVLQLKSEGFDVPDILGLICQTVETVFDASVLLERMPSDKRDLH